MDLVWRASRRFGWLDLPQRPSTAHASPGGGTDLDCCHPSGIGGSPMIRLLLISVTILFAVGGTLAQAVEPSERLADPVLEERARTLSKELRCLVCQNQSIDESNADLAHDLRILLRQRLVAGDTDQQILDYIAARYGMFVLLDPPFTPATYVLWLTPPLLVLGAGVFLLVRARRRCPESMLPRLTQDEKTRAALLLGDGR